MSSQGKQTRVNQDLVLPMSGGPRTKIAASEKSIQDGESEPGSKKKPILMKLVVFWAQILKY